MRCSPLQLAAQLENTLHPLYWLFGSEAFLKEESARLIQTVICQKEATEHFIFTVDNQSVWAEVARTVQHASLFSSKKLITLRLIGKQTSVAPFLDLLKTAQDCYFLIQAEQNEPPYVQDHGIAIPHWPLSGAQFTKWLAQRARARGLSLTEEALRLFVQQTEGNCLAAAQEIDRLYLEYDFPSSLSPVTITELTQQSQFSVFDLIKAIEARHTARIIKIVGCLKESKTALPLVMWALTQVLAKSSWAGSQRRDALTRLAIIDKQIKSSEGLVWQNIIEISLIFSGFSDFFYDLHT
jgi:DNA polymerase-3 subunit delta